MILLIFAVIYAKEIKVVISIIFAAALIIALWQYAWWGKLIAISIFLIPFILVILGFAKGFIDGKRSKEMDLDETTSRENAYLYVMEYWYKQEGPNVESEIRRVRDWKEDPSSNEIMENWYQENKESFQ